MSDGCYTEALYYDQLSTYARSIERERIDLTSPLSAYYSQRRGANVDPLYNEPGVAWSYLRYSLRLTLKYEEAQSKSESVEEGGSKSEYDAAAVIARNTWEDAIEGSMGSKVPRSGDVVNSNGEWFDVVSSGKDGYVLNSPEFVAYTLKLKRRSEFKASVKINQTHTARISLDIVSESTAGTTLV